jgi:hypothetical protein
MAGAEPTLGKGELAIGPRDSRVMNGKRSGEMWAHCNIPADQTSRRASRNNTSVSPGRLAHTQCESPGDPWRGLARSMSAHNCANGRHILQALNLPACRTFLRSRHRPHPRSLHLRWTENRGVASSILAFATYFVGGTFPGGRLAEQKL